MIGSLTILDATSSDVTLTEDALFVSLQGSPSGPFNCTVPTPEGGAFFVINNATEQIAFVSGTGGNPAQAPPQADTILWVDGLGNGHNLA